MSSKVDFKTSQLILYLAKNIDNLYITKLLKLLYIIDEKSTSETGIPVTWLDYNVWQYGPVNPELHNMLTFQKEGELFDVVNTFNNDYGQIVKPISEFDDGEFSDYEMELIDKVIETYGRLSSNQLVNILHEEGSLWDKEVKKHNLEIPFRDEETTTSPFKINFEDLLEDSPLKKHIFKSAKENYKFINRNQTDCICEL